MKRLLKTAVALVAAGGALFASGSAFAAFPAPYCVNAFSTVEPITKVDIDGIHNASSAPVGGTPSDEDFTAIIGQLAPGGAYPISVQGNSDGNYSNIYAVYIDWDQSGTFEPNESYLIGQIVSSTGADGKTAATTITVPATATLGQTRMRVVKKFSSTVALASAPACQPTAAGFGQAEDYTVNIDPAAPVPPALSKAFAPTNGAAGTTSTLTLTLGNTAASANALTADFTDTLPAGLAIAATPNTATTCTAGTVTTTAGSVTLANGASIPVGGCTVTVDVSAATAGIYVNTIAAGALKTASGDGPGATATYQATTAGVVTYSTGFENPPYTTGNLNGQQGWYASVANDWKVATTNPGAGTQHVRGTWTAAGSGTSVIISPTQAYGTTDYSIASAKLAITVAGTGATWDFAPQDPSAGSVITRVRFLKDAGNKIQVLADTGGGVLGYVDTGATWTGGGAYFDVKLIAKRSDNTYQVCVDGTSIYSGTGFAGNVGNLAIIGTKGTGTQNNLLDVDDLVIDNSNVGTCSGVPALTAPTLAKAFTPASVEVNTDSTATVTLTNSNAAAITLSADLVDTLPAGLVASAASTTCGGTASFTAGTLTLASGATIPASGSCTLTGTVQSATAGSYDNTIAAGALQTDAGSNAAAASATLTVTAVVPSGPSLAKSFTPASVAPNAQSTAMITLTNPNATPATLTADLVDQFPTGVTIVSASTTCGLIVGSAPSTNLPAANGSVTLPAGVKIPANGSCAINAVVTAAAAGTYTNTLAAGALQTDAGNNAAAASADLTVIAVVAPTVAKAFTPASVEVNTDSVATITLTNANAAAITLSADLVDTLPAGLVASAASTTCGGTASFAAGTLTLATGATIPAGDSCTLTGTVQSATVGSYTNTIAAGALQTDAGNNAAAASATLTVTAATGFPAPYCAVDFPSSVEPISRVVFDGIDNPSSPVVGATPPLEDFLTVMGTVSQGGTYSMAVEGNTDGGFTTKIKVYIDWNQNNSFADPGESYVIGDLVNSTGTDGKQAVADILVPADAMLGTTRMRVTKKFNTAADPCNTTGYGQAEDYTLTVNNDPLPLPNADVDHASFTLTAEQNATATDTLKVSNTGPGRLTFNITRALSSRPAAANAASKATEDKAVIARNDMQKLALSGAVPLPAAVDMLTASNGYLPIGGHGILASDPECDASTPSIIVHDHGGAPENGYGWNASAGTSARMVDKFTPTTYPGTFSTACVSFLTNAGLTSAAVKIVAYADDGAGGAPGTELGSVSVTANNIGTGLVEQFQAFDISSMNLSIASGSVYIGVEWDATSITGLYVGADESSTSSADGYQYTTDWAPTTDAFPDYKAMYIRAVEGIAGPPGIGCDHPSNVPWLSVTPNSGTINGVGSKDVTVKANATGLAIGTYDALLCVNTNDAAHPRFEIPVAFTVTAITPPDLIFKDGFDGASGNPNVVTGTINQPAVADDNGSSFDFALGDFHGYDAAATGDDINLYTLAAPAISVYWYGDVVPAAFSTLVGGVVGTPGGTDFVVLHSGDTIGAASPVSAASQGADMSAFEAGVDGYIGVAFYNETTSALNFGYLHVTTSAGGFPIQVLDYGYDNSGADITIP